MSIRQLQTDKEIGRKGYKTIRREKRGEEEESVTYTEDIEKIE